MEANPISDSFLSAKSILDTYVESNKLRKTSERYYLLELIYGMDKHFDAENLYQLIKSQTFNVSKATVYNTLDLFVTCGVVTKHFLNHNTSIYERAIGQKQHDHFICSQCHKVIEFCDPRLYQIKKSLEEALNVHIENHNLYLYGKCKNPDCKPITIKR